MPIDVSFGDPCAGVCVRLRPFPKSVVRRMAQEAVGQLFDAPLDTFAEALAYAPALLDAVGVVPLDQAVAGVAGARRQS